MSETRLTVISNRDETQAARMSELTDEDRAALAIACRQLETITFASRLTALLGRQIETAGALIPAPLRQLASRAATRALQAAMRAALQSLKTQRLPASPVLHRITATAAGAAGGAFGLLSLPIELPISTVILLRAIADTARRHGEDLGDAEAALACIQVFALGGRTPEDDFMDSSYFAVRAVLARSISEAARYVAATAAVDEAAPILMRVLSQVATRFGVVVTQKFAAQAVPVLGAAGGAAVNYAFMDHFQTLADGHFTVRRLERKYGQSVIRDAYVSIQASALNK